MIVNALRKREPEDRSHGRAAVFNCIDPASQAWRDAKAGDVARLRHAGTDLSDQEIWFIAHLDHCQPSANDNASGSAAILETARLHHFHGKLNLECRLLADILTKVLSEFENRPPGVQADDIPPEIAVKVEASGQIESVRESPVDTRGWISVAVSDGVVTLNGELPGLDEKRLAGVLAWWVPGSRDVVNGIAVEPPEEDSFDMIAEAVRLVLEKDPFVNAGQIRVGVRRTTVTLAGLLPSEAQRDMAEKDAWYVFGVDKVINNIEVRPG